MFWKHWMHVGSCSKWFYIMTTRNTNYDQRNRWFGVLDARALLFVVSQFVSESIVQSRRCSKLLLFALGQTMSNPRCGCARLSIHWRWVYQVAIDPIMVHPRDVEG